MIIEIEDKKMKKYITIIAILLLFAIGCSEQTSINSPDDTLSKVSATEPNWISMPTVKTTTRMSVMSTPLFQVNKDIDGNKGGKLNIDQRYPGGPFGEIKVKAELAFPSGAFQGTKYITMIVDTAFGLATFLPHAYFSKNAKYNAEIVGLDLTGVDPQNVGFVYQAEDGTYEYIDYTKVEVDLRIGKLKVRDAMLPHFSRYGFVNKNL
jgi:hypothetical protein